MIRDCCRRDCDATTLDLDHDGVDEVLIANRSAFSVYREEDGVWVHLGRGYASSSPPGGRIDAADVSTAPTQFDDIVINGRRARFQRETEPCR